MADNKSITERLNEVFDLTDKLQTTMFGTVRSDGYVVSRPMHVPTRVNEVDFYLFTNLESHKCEDLEKNNKVNLAYYRESDGSWASISGNASIVKDRVIITKHYKTSLKAWFADLGDGVHDGSKDDPRIVLIHVKTASIHYQIQAGVITKTFEMAKGMLTSDKAHLGHVYVIEGEPLEAARKLASV